MAQLVFRRGDIHWVEFPKKELGKEIHTIQEEHPAIIISNDKQNQFSSVITVLPITSQLDKAYPFEVLIQLKKPSKILIDQITTIDKVYVKRRITSLTEKELMTVEKCLHLTLALKG
ncbi:type II toxin-antitoxin system PemK/MazF family toxin [endosymbiont GvMRE of Glomus versiforme]|uniref:type II toxin-antitoxin system PemK/MazF family toxin n=1 Tax=endosymbiont GvMRE of Glomus versiforme TaxID=2039283 RepID=UPI000EF067E8|nr:type II toxin-antitoxin system PemK/MazF family toxin [endosymbiont GvMRE of Glomus versiforme]RHZ36313.1 mRNA interferase [endosymbiont GvMRE of Glomus versiforme]RHZ37724.1 mRNA interferase [endosymbiont GvMRE of Glomus versiforme]